MENFNDDGERYIDFFISDIYAGKLLDIVQ